LKNVRKSNINYCKCTIEKVHETNRMLKSQIWNRMLKSQTWDRMLKSQIWNRMMQSQIWNRMLKSQIWNRMLKSQMCITQVNTSQSQIEIQVSGVFNIPYPYNQDYIPNNLSFLFFLLQLKNNHILSEAKLVNKNTTIKLPDSWTSPYCDLVKF